MTDPSDRSAAGVAAARCWTLTGDPGTLDVEVVATRHHRLADVLPELTALLGRPVEGLWSGSTRLSDDTPLTAPALDHGAVLGAGRPTRERHPGGTSSALELHVVGGPDAGRWFPLGQGDHVIGRGGRARVRLHDPDVSRRHASVRVGSGSVTVADLSSTNGTRLDGAHLSGEPHEWPPGTVLRLGLSALVLTGPAAPATSPDQGTDGRRRVRPVLRMSTPTPDVDVAFPRPPAPAPRRRLAWIAVALPAVGGVAMAWLLDAPTFLFFALLSPVVALGTWISERWSGRRSGRREAAAHALEVGAAEARLGAALRADARTAEVTHPDLAALAVAARRRTAVLWSRSRDAEEALAVRIGSGPGPTRVFRIDGDGVRTRQTAPHLPVVVDLRATGGLAVVGPRGPATGALSAAVAQLCTLHAPGEVDLLVLVAADRLPDWAWTRWLPHLAPGAVHVLPPGHADDAPPPADGLPERLAALAAGRRADVDGRPDRRPGWLVIVVDGALDPRSAASLRSARAAGIVVLTSAGTPQDLAAGADAVLQLSGETGDTGILNRQGHPDRGGLTVDRLPATLAADLARDLGGLAPVETDSSLPHRVRLLDVVPTGDRPGDGGEIPVSWQRHRDRLVAPLGRTAHGPLVVDLCRQGPHALIAGTTGSGKSELLQTLIAGLALTHPPDRCSFLLVDYKGGAAFAEAAALPHTVGLVTDLDGRATARALRSLAAELTRRESILAEHGVADIAALPGSADLARLVIVVDEFAGLAEELPEFVPGLVAIAQRGRSLGVHLVLATQRPSGVVSPEIRANCSLRICLRTTDEAESRDVLGTAAAAHLPLDLPGRAWLRSGSGAPTALQVARVSGHAPPAGGTRPAARRWSWPLAGPPDEEHGPAGATDLGRLCTALTEHARRTGTPMPHRPWRPPLPDRLPAGTLTADGPPPGPGPAVLPLGLVDRPDLQTQEVLGLDLDDGGTWLAVGGPRSGRTTLLLTVLGEAVHRLGPDELHVHVLEAGAGLLATAAARHPHSGTVVGGEDALRTVRLVDRLAQEVANRRAGARATATPRILLLVDGIESISALLDEADPGRGSAHLLRVLRDGAAVGLTCVATADRAVPGGRLAAVARRRLVLPLPDRADYAVAGIANRDVPAHRHPGRALVGEEARECQLALPRAVATAGSGGSHGPGPLRIVELPADPRLPLPAPGRVPADPTAEGRLLLPIGPGGDEGQPLGVDLLRTGGLLVTGPAGSGRSSALAAFALHLASLPTPLLVLGRVGGPADGLVDAARLDPADDAGTAEWLAGLDGRPGVVLADDLGTPADAPALSRLGDGDHRRVVLLAAAHAGHLSAHYQGPVAALRRSRTGLLLCPGPGDADLLGVRLPRTAVPHRPGSGWLVTGAGMQRVQVARRQRPEPAPPPASDQRSSSADPISWRAYQASS
ncbi:FtsK/SpoIIIE domain-containing protein [Blastococcus tunisiensis]|uniref:DNA segregation ATPase FtsK/SpoIIIE, S-DNA-T family n=1 Tax=Blastococcus tunisiensis TaxID=1798228 RepID=A0A1I1WRC6_9ACTN|nr:FtsK/SpoIIIE domain-containing protein [Blastococcus sp. DSM 46838]SFD96928.1 DNA segregation ATPase FtsK/SpoIIIE, S-DNA-T family [Blastococcus sp. DSM 46838]